MESSNRVGPKVCGARAQPPRLCGNGVVWRMRNDEPADVTVVKHGCGSGEVHGAVGVWRLGGAILGNGSDDGTPPRGWLAASRDDVEHEGVYV